MTPFVKPVITQLVAGDTTEQVLAGESATPEALKAVTSIDEGGPTVDEVDAGVGVTVTSVFPAETETVGTPGANRVHWGYKVTLEVKVTDCEFVKAVPEPFAAVFQPLKVLPGFENALAGRVNAVPPENH